MPTYDIYSGAIAPDGTIHSPISNITAFSREHGLVPSSMYCVLNKKQREHKGWTLYRMPDGRSGRIVKKPRIHTRIKSTKRKVDTLPYWQPIPAVLMTERLATMKRVSVDFEAAKETLQKMRNLKRIANRDFDGCLMILIESAGHSGLFAFWKRNEGTLWSALDVMYPEVWCHFKLDGEALKGVEFDGDLNAGVKALYEKGIEAITNDKEHRKLELLRPGFHGFFVKQSEYSQAVQTLSMILN